MRSTHNTLLAYGKGIAATVTIVTGTAAMMSAFSDLNAPLKDYSQNKLTHNNTPLNRISPIERVEDKLYPSVPSVSNATNFRLANPS